MPAVTPLPPPIAAFPVVRADLSPPFFPHPHLT